MSFLKNKKKRNYFALSAYIFIFLIVLIGAKYFIQKQKLKNILKITSTVQVGRVKYKVFVAKTLGEKKQGLMNVPQMPRNYGMLFVFHKKVDYPFWMKNTLMPLTVLFIYKDRVINQINMKPCKTPKCKFYEPFVYYKYALEIEQNGRNLIGKKVKIGGLS